MPEDDGWQVYRRGPTGCFTSSRLPPTCWKGSTQNWCSLVLTIWMFGGVVILNNLDESTEWSVKCWLFTSWCQPTKTIRFYLIHGQSPRWWSQGLNAGHLRSALFVWPSTQVEGCVRTIDFFVFLFRKAMGGYSFGRYLMSMCISSTLVALCIGICSSKLNWTLVSVWRAK